MRSARRSCLQVLNAIEGITRREFACGGRGRGRALGALIVIFAPFPAYISSSPIRCGAGASQQTLAGLG
jgi:hypothetical protein